MKRGGLVGDSHCDQYVLISKRHKINYYVTKPELISNHDVSGETQSMAELLEFFQHRDLDVGVEYFEGGSHVSYKVDLEFQFRVAEPAPVLFVFFGIVSENYIESLSRCYCELARKYHCQVLGISANVKTNPYAFPVISDDKGWFARYFKVLDPLGGGVYPLDRLFLVDSVGDVRAEFQVENSCGQRFKGALNPEEIIVNLIECLQYLNKMPPI